MQLSNCVNNELKLSEISFSDLLKTLTPKSLRPRQIERTPSEPGEIIGTMLSLRFVLKMFGDEFVHRILNDVRGVNDGRHQNPFLTRRSQKTPQYNSAV